MPTAFSYRIRSRVTGFFRDISRAPDILRTSSRALGVLTATCLLSSCIYYNGPGGWSSDRDMNRIAGSGHSVTEIRQVGGIDRVHLANQGDLTIMLGDTESLVVEADDNLMAYIRTEVHNGELRIFNDDRVYFHNRDPVRYYLTVTGLSAIEASSTGSIEAPALTAKRFDIRVSSTGDVIMDGLDAGDVRIDVSSTGDVILHRLEATTLDVRQSSTGNVNIDGGRVSSQAIRLTSTGSFDAERLVSKVTEVDLNSTGSAYVTVDDYLEGHLTSTGSLHYRGYPRTDIRRSSTGRAIQLSRR